MEIRLSPELEQIVNDKVASGLYPSASEFIREAILRVVEQDLLKRQKLNEAIALGIEQAERGEFSARTVRDIVADKENQQR